MLDLNESSLSKLQDPDEFWNQLEMQKKSKDEQDMQQVKNLDLVPMIEFNPP